MPKAARDGVMVLSDETDLARPTFEDVGLGILAILRKGTGDPHAASAIRTKGVIRRFHHS